MFRPGGASSVVGVGCSVGGTGVGVGVLVGVGVRVGVSVGVDVELGCGVRVAAEVAVGGRVGASSRALSRAVGVGSGPQAAKTRSTAIAALSLHTDIALLLRFITLILWTQHFFQQTTTQRWTDPDVRSLLDLAKVETQLV